MWRLGLALAMACGCGHRADYNGVELSEVPLTRSLDRAAQLRASTAAVAIVETDVGRGMAFVVDPDGYLITARHVVEDADHVESMIFPSRDPNRRYESVEVVYIDPVVDVALLRVHTRERLPYLPVATEKIEPVSRYVSVSDPVVLLERQPDSIDPGLRVRRGFVRKLRGFNPAAGPNAFVGVSNDVAQGQSGGPVLDRDGRAVGNVTWTWRDRAGGYAIPFSDAT
jgi:serine protease Do